MSDKCSINSCEHVSHFRLLHRVAEGENWGCQCSLFAYNQMMMGSKEANFDFLHSLYLMWFVSIFRQDLEKSLWRQFKGEKPNTLMINGKQGNYVLSAVHCFVWYCQDCFSLNAVQSGVINNHFDIWAFELLHPFCL